jgi:hypothetical protein
MTKHLSLFIYKTHKEFPATLMNLLQKYSIEIELRFESFPSKLAELFEKAHPGTDLQDLFSDDMLLLSEYCTNDRRLLASVDPEHPFAISFKQQHQGAVWGGSSSHYALDYSPVESRLLNQVHESLHLLSVADCYTRDNPAVVKRTCNNPSCLMRYGNLTRELCDGVVCQLNQFAAL